MRIQHADWPACATDCSLAVFIIVQELSVGVLPADCLSQARNPWLPVFLLLVTPAGPEGLVSHEVSSTDSELCSSTCRHLCQLLPEPPSPWKPPGPAPLPSSDLCLHVTSSMRHP